MLSREERMDQLTPLDRTIDGIVTGDGNGNAQLVKTVRGVGYVFAGETGPI